MIESFLELLDGFSCALVVSDFVRNGEQKQNCRLPVPTHLSSNSNIYISNGSFSQVICFLSLKKTVTKLLPVLHDVLHTSFMLWYIKLSTLVQHCLSKWPVGLSFLICKVRELTKTCSAQTMFYPRVSQLVHYGYFTLDNSFFWEAVLFSKGWLTSPLASTN